MDATQDTPQSSISVEDRMDVDDSLPSRDQTHLRDDFVPARPGSEISIIYTPTQTKTASPPYSSLRQGQPISPVPFPLLSKTSADEQITAEPFSTPVPKTEPILAPYFEKTVEIGSENVVFNQVCDHLDRALSEWDERVSDEDKENNPSADVILLRIPSYLSELIVYGMRPGGKQYWEGDLNLFPPPNACGQTETRGWQI